jgi:hypothetical protein
VVGVWDGTEQRIYINAQAAGKTPTKDLILSATSVGTEVARLGSQAKSAARPKRHFRGLIDEVAIFNRALSHDEIRDLHRLGLRGQSLRSSR